ATEEILRILVPAVGVAAFSLVVPVTTALLIVLAFLILSYRETIKAYPTAGGAYMVTRDNFGLLPAQVAGVALLTDYVLTVAVAVGHGGGGLLYGAGLVIVVRAFASGGAAVTGVEAISNGVTAFKRPEWKNARETLVIMGSTLGVMFFGLSALSTKVHAIPFRSGTPTVISQIGKFTYGGGPVASVLYYGLQAGTML